MTEEFQYRPPLNYLLGAFLTLAISTLFTFALFRAWGKDLIFTIFAIAFALICLAAALALFILFFKKFTIGNLKIGEDFIEIPGRWKEPIRLNFDDIKSFSSFDTYDHIIEIKSNRGIHLIESNWMKAKDFERVKERLVEYERSTQID